MLDNERPNHTYRESLIEQELLRIEALRGSVDLTDPMFISVLMEQHYQTQNAFMHLGMDKIVQPSEVLHVGDHFMVPELYSSLRIPYAVEVLGMPRAGKTTLLNRYMRELWIRKERHNIFMVTEGARSIKEQYGDLRYSDPFTYAMMGGLNTMLQYTESLRNINMGMRMVVSDRGAIDRRIFRRSLFEKGEVNPKLMIDEDQFIHDFEHTPMQVGGIIMVMTRPEVSLDRSKKEGPVANREFLELLHEQYWRLHWELIKGKEPYRIYTCIDGEMNPEEVYQQFIYAMDKMLYIHDVLLYTISQTHPEEFDEAQVEYNKTGAPKDNATRILEERLKRKVLIVGGDDMREDDLFNKPFLETIDLKE